MFQSKSPATSRLDMLNLLRKIRAVIKRDNKFYRPLRITWPTQKKWTRSVLHWTAFQTLSEPPHAFNDNSILWCQTAGQRSDAESRLHQLQLRMRATRASCKCLVSPCKVFMGDRYQYVGPAEKRSSLGLVKRNTWPYTNPSILSSLLLTYKI